MPSAIVSEAVAPREALAAYGEALMRLGKARLAGAAGLVLVGSLIEGVGIVLLVPLVVLVLAGSLANLPQIPAMLRPLVPAAPAAQLTLLVGAFFGLMLLRAVILLERDRAITRLSFELIDVWRDRAMRRLAAARWSTLQRLRHGDVAFALTNDVNRLSVGSDRLLRGSAAVLQIAVQLGVAFTLAPELAALAVALLFLLLPITIPLLRRSHRYGELLTREGKRRHGAFGDFLASVKLAKAHNAEARYADEFAVVGRRLREASLAAMAAQQRGGQAFQLAAALAACLLLLLGALVTHTPGPVLSAMLVLIARLAGPALLLAQGAQGVAAMLPAVSSLVALERELAVGAEMASGVSGENEQRPALVEFDRLRFRHEGTGRDLLHDLSATIAPGALVALVGPSGSGKTTLADLAIALLPPDAGAVRIDGVALDDDAARAVWRRQIGYVPQEPFLFDRSIAENLLWGAPDADEAALWRALEAAEAARFVRALPDGLSTRAGERGSRFSGGERQRLCLARALVRTPRLLVLDEATSALDPETERRLFATFERLRGQVTMLLITHRLPEEVKIDAVWRLESGRVIVEH